MKFFLISDNSDTLVGMRLAGIDGVCCKTPKEGNTALQVALRDESIGIILVTPQISALCKEKIAQYSKLAKPLIVTIPDSNGGGIENNMTKYISEAIGIQL